ncbi:hypothetical protein ILUMI_24826 [Ignelater luminosus]|uniref:EGF-like domain-containing protein n=1 Tax=Ignelater luminosus TaxID=2038154 RepID=A0A8K0CBR8_IGNLU|nr:hypothetical protein ILUMI_24826 [Ignelater luminosus]
MYHFILVFINVVMTFRVIVGYYEEYSDVDVDQERRYLRKVSQPLKTTTTAGHTTGMSNESAFTQIGDALKDIAYYLRAHKFNEYDRRYEADAETAAKEYFKIFPKPPLRSLHWEVHKFCEVSFMICIEYLSQRVKATALKRADDTAVVIQEQQWDSEQNSKQIDAVERECRIMLKTDNTIADPFQGPIERFQWRTTASYYMCWYTMKEIPQLKQLKENCDNVAYCLDPKYGVHNFDPRADDGVPYACALYSFCPDPCCPYKHLNSLEECWESPDNPCFVGNSAGRRICSLNRSQNTDFRDIVLNRWNVTCKCPNTGYEWDSKYGMCVDIDECLGGLHGCDPKREACVNLPGSFQCACRWGYARNSVNTLCEPSPALEVIRLHDEKPKTKTKGRKASSLVKKVFKILSRKNKSKRITSSLLFTLFSPLISICIEFRQTR